MIQLRTSYKAKMYGIKYNNNIKRFMCIQMKPHQNFSTGKINHLQ